MFLLTYLSRELRRRFARTLLTATGLALGVGLVIGIVGVSQGLHDAQASVLAPLSSVGTDILVTRVVGATPATNESASPSASPTPDQGRTFGGGGFFGGRGGNGGAQALNQADTQALLTENASVVTDLSRLGKPGTTFTHDFFLSATLLSFPATAVSDIAKISGVDSATGGLVQLANHQTGTVPRIVATLKTGGKTFTQTVRPAAMTDAERTAFRTCLSKQGVTLPGQDTQPRPRPSGSAQPGGGGGGRVFDGGGPAFDACLPARFRELRAQFTTPVETLRQAVNPPQTDITSTSYTAAGVDTVNPTLGLVTSEQLTSGRWIAKGSTTEVLLNVAYANTTSLKVGSTIPVNGTTYTVVGLVRPTLTGSTADIYYPLATLQKLASKAGRVTQVLVKAHDSASVDRVAAQIRTMLPGAEVVTRKALADSVTGSLTDARKLADRLGGALAAIVLGAAFAIAVLLTLSAVAKRVREIGTLRAIGWSKGRVVRQLLGETLGIGLLGGILGIAVGAGVAGAVHAFSPSLTASSGGVPGMADSALAGLFGQQQAAASVTHVTLNAPLHASTLLLGVAFALVGGLLAGLVAGWRASRLAPAIALRHLG